MAEEIDLTGLLQGGRLKLAWTKISLSPDLDAGELRAIERFRARAHEFLLNVADLKLPNQREMSLAKDRGRMHVRVRGYPGRHRTKGLFVDFRHLLADKEPGTFRRVRNILYRRASDRTLRTFLDQLYAQFLPKKDEAIAFMGASCSIEDLLKLWFNTEFFHSGDDDQIEERERMLEKLEAGGAAPLLFWAVVRAAHPVKCLYACAKDLGRDGALVVRCPDRRLVFRENVTS